MVLLHANAVNIARRLSIKNEHDLLQETFYDTQSDELNKHECENLALQLTSVAELPIECKNYVDVLLTLARRDSKYVGPHIPNAFEGMYTGQAASAMAARKRGELNHAQIQRRMTRSK